MRASRLLLKLRTLSKSSKNTCYLPQRTPFKKYSSQFERCRFLSSPRFTSQRWLSSAGSSDGPGDSHSNDHDEYDDNQYYEDIEYETFNDAEDDDWDNDGLQRQKKPKSTEETRQVQRLYLDRGDPLEERVEKFLNCKLGQLHPLDIVISAADLMRESGKRKSFEGMKFAQDIMDRILEEKHFVNQHNDSNPHTRIPYTIVIPEKHFEVLMYGWSNLCRRVSFAPERMREVLSLMIQEAEYDERIHKALVKAGTAIGVDPSLVRGKKHSDVDPAQMFASLSCQPTVGIYNTLLQGLSQASYRSIAAASNAEDVLRSMERISTKRGWHTKPNTNSFMNVIRAYARTQHATAGDRAEAVLRRMVAYHERQLREYEEETGVVYDLSDTTRNKRRVVTPDTVAYTGVIQAHGESGAKDSTTKALELLRECLDSDSPSCYPDAYLFSATINVFVKMVSKVKNPDDRRAAAEGAEEILWLMIERMQLSADVDAAQNKDLVVPFNTTLNAWAQSDLPEAPERAEDLLQKMLDSEVRRQTGLVPNTISFNTCMRAWARAARFDNEAPERAEELLHLMEQLEIAEADETSYTTAMNAYARSKVPNKVSQTRRILESMLTGGDVTPSAASFTTVLSSAVHNVSKNPSGRTTDEKELSDFGPLVENDDEEDAYGIALRTYDEIVNDVYELNIEADHLVFATMIDVLGQYTTPDSIERRQRLERVFSDACGAGHVSSTVVQSLAKASPTKEFLLQLLKVDSFPFASVNKLPRQWVRRVEPKFRKIRVQRSSSQRRKGKQRGTKSRQPRSN